MLGFGAVGQFALGEGPNGGTAVIPSFGWFAPLGVPMLRKAGLHASRQQFLAAPPRLLPTPNITGTLSAQESGDSAQFGAAQSRTRVDSGEVGIIETSFTGAQIGVTMPAVSSARVSIQII